MQFKTPLCELAYKYGTDKCPQVAHPYTPYYYEMLKDKRDTVKKVLELGIGCSEGMAGRQHANFVTGASLYMWRGFFPNAHIYGADNHPAAMFQDERISTFYCDVRKKSDLERLIEWSGTDIDLVIDDALHKCEVQISNFLTISSLVKKDVIYVIEDVTHSRKVAKGTGGEIMRFNTPFSVECLVIIRNKENG